MGCAKQPKPPSSTTPGPVLSQVEAGLETEEVQGDETEEDEMQADETGRRRRKDSPWCFTQTCHEAINLCKYRGGKCCNKAMGCAKQPKPPSSTTPGPVLSQVEAGLETEEVQGDETEEEEMQADETDEMQADETGRRRRKDSPW